MTKLTEPMPLKATRDWVEQFVLRYNLCPFAHRPHQQQAIRYHLCNITEPQAIVLDFLREIDLLNQDVAQTTLIVYPSQMTDFEQYLDFVALLEIVLEEEMIDDTYQLASFHPEYVFAESSIDDPANKTNRSPFPMIHILRCSDVFLARQVHPNTESVPARNIQFLRTLFS